MKKSIHVGDVSIPLDSYVVGGSALLGIRNSGKTYAAKGIAEQLLDYDVMPIIFDPVGRWRYLKLAGTDSKKPKGYKIVVAGGEQPDLPLTPQSAPEIVRAAIRENIPLVIDLYDRKLSKADWRRIIQSCFRTLMYENQGARHIFLEEAAEFVPQKVFDNETYAEVEKVVRMGGNVSLGITLINQRAQEVNKAVLDLCENLILMKQRGAHAIDSLEKHMDKLSPDTAAAVAKSLPHMESGEAWVFTPEQEEPRRVRTAPLRSFHPDRRNPQLTAKAAAARSANTEDFVSRLTGKLETVIAEASANDPGELRKRIRALEAQLKNKSPVSPAVDVKQVEKVAFEKGRQTAAMECQKSIFDRLASRQFMNSIADLFKPAFEIVSEKSHWKTLEKTVGQIKAANAAVPPRKIESEISSALNSVRASRSTGSAGLPKGEAAILTVCLQLGNAAREQITVLTGYKRSSRDEYINRLKSKGYVEVGGDGSISPTDTGCAALPDVSPLPTGEELRQFWRQKLPVGELKILEVLMEAHPKSLTRDQLDEAGYKRSSRNEYLNRLRARRLIVEDSSGVKASDNLF